MTFDPDDRDDFLLTGPSCEELSSWYDQFPADTDQDLLGAYIDECGELPEVATEEPATLLKFIRAPKNSTTVAEMLEGSRELRAAATLALATRTCDEIDSGTKSLWQLQTQLARTYQVPVKTANQILAEAAKACPENARLLGLFTATDYAAALNQLRDFINTTYSDGPGAGAGVPDGDLAAMAQTLCSGLADGDSVADAGILFGYFAGFDDFSSDAPGVDAATEAARLFCPQYL